MVNECAAVVGVRIGRRNVCNFITSSAIRGFSKLLHAVRIFVRAIQTKADGLNSISTVLLSALGRLWPKLFSIL
jgi:hypothetical protein